jgi:S-DNA-T family DNA segregation ATPase FtsK/SpoIIIE
VHLLLASQRLEEGRLRGLDTHLSYRIGLRTFSAMESRTVLGVPDAYELPRAPGHGYLKFGTEPLTRFKAAYVSGAHEPAASQRAPETTGVDGWRVLPFTTAPVHLPPPVPADTADPGPTDGPAVAAPSLLDLLADALRGAGAPAHQVWLPPLSVPAGLDELLGQFVSDPERGVTTVDPGLHGGLRVPVAQVDKPFEQRRDPLWLRLDSAGGHVAIVGGPQAGKSILVCTLVCALALTHTPCELTAYCLDFGGGGLGVLRGLPHVGTVVGRLAAEAVRRTVGEVATVLADRERRVATAGAGATWRDPGTDGAADPYGDLFLVVDGWSTVRTDYEDLEPLITDIATRGPSYGVHVVVTAGRWTDLRPALRDLFGHRLELRLGDPADSQVNRRTASDVPEGTPGRGITGDGLHFLAGTPVVSGHGTEEVVAAVRASWPGPAAPAVRELPAVVPYEHLAIAAATGGRDLALPVGLAETDLRPVELDFAADPHLLLFGDSGCGKSAFLRALATSISRRFRPEQARIVMLDYRRSMLGEVGGDHLIGYATSAGPAAELLDSVASYLADRLPGPDVTAAQLRARSWWTGPECFVLVDDYDLVAAGAANPVAALLDYLPQARDVGLHLVVARRCGGATRALFEPTLARLRELATPGLIMSGDREEGVLLGSVRPQPMPPGRATFVHRRDGNRVVQLAYQPPAADEPT